MWRPSHYLFDHYSPIQSRSGCFRTEADFRESLRSPQAFLGFFTWAASFALGNVEELERGIAGFGSGVAGLRLRHFLHVEWALRAVPGTDSACASSRLDTDFAYSADSSF